MPPCFLAQHTQNCGPSFIWRHSIRVAMRLWPDATNFRTKCQRQGTNQWCTLYVEFPTGHPNPNVVWLAPTAPVVVGNHQSALTNLLDGIQVAMEKWDAGLPARPQDGLPCGAAETDQSVCTGA